MCKLVDDDGGSYGVGGVRTYINLQRVSVRGWRC